MHVPASSTASRVSVSQLQRNRTMELARIYRQDARRSKSKVVHRSFNINIQRASRFSFVFFLSLSINNNI